VIAAGKLDKRITLQRNEGTANADGEIVASWVDKYQNVPARIEPLSGRELFSARQVNAELTHKVTIRREDKDVKPADRISYLRSVPLGETAYFDILAPPNVHEADQTLELLCVERVGRDN
jgi:SPP1 family predicted phage head-tail adaptor